MGRTKGGLNTKLLAWVDARGRAVQVTLAAGQRADVRAASEAPWPKRLRGAIAVADKGFDSDAFRAQLCQRGCGVCIPPRSNRRMPAAWHRGYYRQRHKVEKLANLRKEL